MESISSPDWDQVEGSEENDEEGEQMTVNEDGSVVL
jgi:hypothetical protein